MRSRITRIRLLALLTALAALLAAPAARADQPSAQLYVSANGGGAIDPFAAGPDGALGALGEATTVGGRPAGVAFAPDGRSLYLANQAAGTLSRFDVADDGTLGEPVTVPAGEAPFGVAVAPDGAHVYVTDRALGEVEVFDVDAAGALAEASTAPAGDGAVGIALNPDGTSAYVANFEAGTVSWFAVADDGSLDPRGSAQVPGGSAPFAVAVAPDGEAAYVTDQSTHDAVLQYDVAPGGALTPKEVGSVPAGRSPAGLVATRDSVYVADFGSDALTQYDAGPNGALDPKAPATVPAGHNPWALALAPDGRSLYAADYGADAVSQYDVGDDGALAPKAAAVATGARPIALAVRAAPDVTSPTIDLVAPADGASYDEDETVAADYTCDDAGPSGLASCEGTVPDGDPVDTSTPGDHEFTVVARDEAGNETRVVHDYTVVAAPTEPGLPGWDGFAWPVRELPAVNTVSAGREALVRFRLGGADDADPADVLADGSPSSVRVDCDDPGEPTAGQPASDASGDGLQRSGDTFSFLWQTRSTWKGTCRMLLVELRDGSVHRALFAFSGRWH